MIIIGTMALYCGSQSVLFEALNNVKEFIQKSESDPLFIKNLNSEKKEKYRHDFNLIDAIYGLNEEEQKYYEQLKS